MDWKGCFAGRRFVELWYALWKMMVVCATGLSLGLGVTVAYAESSVQPEALSRQATSHRGQLQHPSDLRLLQEPSNQKMPDDGEFAVVILFSIPDCTWCEEIRSHTLRHVEADRRYQGRVRVYEVNQQASEMNIVWFDGVRRSGEKIARLLGVRFSPTVLVFDEKGVVAGKPLVGASLPDFYASYLDELIRAAWQLP